MQKQGATKHICIYAFGRKGLSVSINGGVSDVSSICQEVRQSKLQKWFYASKTSYAQLGVAE